MATAAHISPSLALLFLLSLLCPPPSLARTYPFEGSLVLVPTPPTILSYHHGPLLTLPFQLHLLWYGSFTPAQKAVVSDFISSFQAKTAPGQPSVASWWQTALLFKDASNKFVSSRVSLGRIYSDTSYSVGKNLTQSGIATLVEKSVASGALPAGPSSVYLVLTSGDVLVQGFCMSSCGFHGSTGSSAATKKQSLLYLWVGNSAKQCPGLCAWPYAIPEFGPPGPPLVSPNADIGMDGMVINIATQLADTATNPFNTGYFQGVSSDPLEAATACSGMFGTNSYPGNAGDLLVNKATKASYNAVGVNNRMFLLPALWSPSTQACKTMV